MAKRSINETANGTVLESNTSELSRALEALREAREVLKNVNEATRSTIDSAIQDAGELLHKWDSHD